MSNSFDIGWLYSLSTTSATSASSTSNSYYRPPSGIVIPRRREPAYDEVVKEIERNFDPEMFKQFEETIDKHRRLKSKMIKKEYMFNPDDLDLEGGE